MKIFVADVLLHILKESPEDPSIEVIPVESGAAIIAIYEKIAEEGMSLSRVYHFLPTDYKKVVEQFKARFELIEAAGGIVIKGSRVLFMKRLGKWDLPKGKIDKGEDEKMAAVREVEEECGIKAKILYKIGNTWHTYIQADKSHKLKKTVWFVMQCLEDKNLQPQEDEGITKVKWTKPHGIEKKLANSYASILHVYRKFERKLQKKAMQNLTTAVEETV